MRSLFHTLCPSLLAALMSFSSAAHAADGDDIVLLNNGGRVRGTVIEEDPKNGVRIKLLDGTLKTLTPAEVKEIHYGDQPAAPAPAPTPAPAPAPAPAAAWAAPAALPYAEAPAPGPPPPAAAPGTGAGELSHGFVLGLRFGFAMPMGNFVGESTTTVGGTTTTTPSYPLSDLFSGKIPILIEAGYEVSSHLVLGLYGSYGFIIDKTGDKGCAPGVDCSDRDVELGIQGVYRFLPGRPIDPWLGLGIGYEWESFSQKGTLTDTSPPVSYTFSGQDKGPQYLKLQGGADFVAAQPLGVGPFVSLSFAKYTSITQDNGTFDGMTTQGSTTDVPNTAFHEWFTFGVRGTFRAGGS